MSAVEQSGMKVMRGIPVSEGVCQGKVLVLGKKQEDEIVRYEVAEADVPEHIHRLEQAMVNTRQQILEVQQKVSQTIGAQDAGIFDAHLLVLEDPRRAGSDVVSMLEHEAAEVGAWLVPFQEDGLRVNAEEVLAIPFAVIVALVGKCLFVPGCEPVIDKQVQLEVDMRAVFGNAFTRVGGAAHDGDGLTRLDGLPDG